jgi:hypothetical protein
LKTEARVCEPVGECVEVIVELFTIVIKNKATDKSVALFFLEIACPKLGRLSPLTTHSSRSLPAEKDDQ